MVVSFALTTGVDDVIFVIEFRSLHDWAISRRRWLLGWPWVIFPEPLRARILTLDTYNRALGPRFDKECAFHGMRQLIRVVFVKAGAGYPAGFVSEDDTIVGKKKPSVTLSLFLG